MSAFERELEGSNVNVSGKFMEERIDQEYVEKLRKGDTEEHHDHEGDNSHQHIDKEKTGDSVKKNESKSGVSEEYIKELEQKINNSEKGYISEYWLVASKVKKETN